MRLNKHLFLIKKDVLIQIKFKINISCTIVHIAKSLYFIHIILLKKKCQTVEWRSLDFLTLNIFFT